jgi:hypothetical protein
LIQPNIEPEEDVKHMGVVPVSLELMAEFLKMPPGTVIESINVDPYRPDLVYLRVQHPSLPPVRKGQILPRVNLVHFSDGRPSQFQ